MLCCTTNCARFELAHNNTALNRFFFPHSPNSPPSLQFSYSDNHTSSPSLPDQFLLCRFPPPSLCRFQADQITPFAHPSLSRVRTTTLHSSANLFATDLFLLLRLLCTRRQNLWVTIAARGRLEAERRREARKERDVIVKSLSKMRGRMLLCLMEWWWWVEEAKRDAGKRDEVS